MFHLPLMLQFNFIWNDSLYRPHDSCACTWPLLVEGPEASPWVWQFSFSSHPTGVIVSLSIYALHHNPKVWPNPEVWWPGRWVWENLCSSPPLCGLEERFDTSSPAMVLSLQVFDPFRFAPGSDRHSHAFLPFSAGSRWGLLHLSV